jgi:LmbE family N-acetylglucosaminyl deacetylase
VLRLLLGSEPRALHVLAVGAHSDDIEIGCGGTILRLAAEGTLASVRWVVLSAEGEREAEARQGARSFLAEVDDTDILVARFRDGFFPYLGEAVKDFFEANRDPVIPDLILSPRREDPHQDHRLVGELVWNTYRDSLILEYEIPKYEGEAGMANVFVELPESTCDLKVDLLTATFRSQATRRWFDPDLFRASLRLRGLECNSSTRFAEGFICRKAII